MENSANSAIVQTTSKQCCMVGNIKNNELVFKTQHNGTF